MEVQNMPLGGLELQQLVAMRPAVKAAEDQAIETRRRLDDEIATRMRTPEKPEGTVSQKINGYKVSVTYGITRSVNKDDLNRLQGDWMNLHAVAKQAFRWKAEVSVAELHKLEGEYLKLAQAYITSKPSSPQVKVEAE